MVSTKATERTIQDATVRIIISESTGEWLSGWFFSRQGHMLTAGHSFSDNDIEIGDVFSIEWDKSENKLSAKLVDFEFMPEKCEDWAILQVVSPSIINDYPAIPLQKQLNPAALSDVLMYGHPEFSKGYSSWARGKILGTSIKNNTKGSSFCQIDLSSPINLEGASGAAIVQKCKRKGFVAIGIQTNQSNASESQAFFVPLNKGRLANQISRILKLLQKPLSLGFDVDTLVNGKVKDKEVLRYALAKAPLCHIDEKGDKIISQVFRSKDKLNNEIQKEIRKTDWLPKSIKIKELDIFGSYKDNIASENISLYDLFDENPLAVNRGPSLCRIVLDIGGNIQPNASRNFRSEHYLSHLVGILVKDEDAVSYDENYDFSITLSSENESQAVDKILGKIQDVILDCFVFHSIPILSQIFSCPDLRRNLSKLKVEFAHLANITPFGMPIDYDKASYISFSSCSRDTLLSNIDQSKYKKIWTEFINYVFYSDVTLLGNNPDSNLIGISSGSELYEILSSPFLFNVERYSGQLSLSKLEHQFNKLKANNNETCFAAFAWNRPKRVKDRNALATLFGKKRCLQNMVSLFRSHDLQNVMRYREFVKVYCFKVSMD